MRTFYCRMIITRGRGEGRQEICLARNIEAADRADAMDRMTSWADLHVRDFTDQDTRVNFDVSLGGSSAPSAIG